MKVRELKELLEEIDPELDVYTVWEGQEMPLDADDFYVGQAVIYDNGPVFGVTSSDTMDVFFIRAD